MRRRRARPGRHVGRRAEPVTVEIEGLAAKGDGVGTGEDGRRYFVPFTLPGDRVSVRPGKAKGDGIAGTPEHWLTRASERAEPFCPRFGTCGGCSVQHLPPPGYAGWKRGLVADALARRGFRDVAVAEPLMVPRDARRRASFGFVRTAGGLVLGFQRRESHDIVDIDACPLLVPALNGLLARLRTFVERGLATVRRGRLALTAAGTPASPAFDVVIEGDSALDLAAREAIAGFAEANDVARICWQEEGLPPEPVVQRREVEAVFDGLGVVLPPGSFLQPSAEGEAHLRRLVAHAAGGAERIADLFSGLGTFALPLAREAHVRAVDGDAAAVAALSAAAGRHGLGGRLQAEARDLARQPLLAAEIDRAGFDAVVFDPPRAGAAAQAEEIAASAGVTCVIGVSCQPATFARDARLLVDGGFALETVTTVDQFPFSHHVELVGTFRRA
jgi:23S rRNA (uracil1939-C5)-methyltransferase